jgi:hypothetical protein
MTTPRRYGQPRASGKREEPRNLNLPWSFIFPMLNWEDMTERYPRCHIITGVSEKPLHDSEGRLLRQVILATTPRGEWASRAISLRDREVVQIMFENGEDAQNVGKALGAIRMGRMPGWVTQRSFNIDTQWAKRIHHKLDMVDRTSELETNEAGD